MAARRLLLVAVLGATLLVGAAIVGFLVLASPPEDETSNDPALRRPAFTAGAPELPRPADADPLGAAPAPPPAATVIPTGPNVIIARVVDDETGAPVLAFSVKRVPHDGRPAAPRLAETPGRPQPMRAPGGVFHLESEKGRWDVVVLAAGYLPGELYDVAVPRPDSKPLELRLSHGPSITGIVYDDEKMGVQDVAVFLKVQKLAMPGPGPAVSLVRTDSEGRYRFSPLPAGVYTVAVVEPDSLDRVVDIVLDRGTAEVPVYVSPRHQVVIQVNGSGGQPLAGAQVELRAPGAVASEQTNGAGQARLRFLKAGRYAVRVSGEGHADLNETIDLVGASGEVVFWYTLRAAP
jgi:hypothetical protein